MRAAALKVVCQLNDLRDRFQVSRKQDDATGLIFPEEGSKFS
jgi:hypothetical protein